MHRTLIVARMRQDAAPAVAQAFADSDATDLPRMIGVSRRTLFRYHDLYFHLVEADQDIGPGLDHARGHPLYRAVDGRLRDFITPYDPQWREPRDSMAEPFYIWTADQGRLR